MKNKKNKINRRDFLKTAGAAGLGSIFVSAKTFAEPNDSNTAGQSAEPEFPQVPKRKLGKTGVEVPSLSTGIMYNAIDKQLILRKALQWGVSYWDTAYGYAGGNSEVGIGKYISANPDVRKKLFIVTKASGAKTSAEREKLLLSSLERMNTDYIDLYYGVHGCNDPAQLTDELKLWAENAKKRKLIRFFGFSTHTNMAKCLTAAAKLGWIDAIMTSYNFRLMQGPEMQAAVEACHKAGVGLIAMKVMAKLQQIETEKDKKLADHFLKSGFTQGQAKIKAVLADKRFCSACISMQNIATLTENVAAVLDKTKLSRLDSQVLDEYAQATCSGYCAGCSDICNRQLPAAPYISEVMRYLMYYNSYGDKDRARELFSQIPSQVKNKLTCLDYSSAEASCPQRLPIAKLVAEAVGKLA